MCDICLLYQSWNSLITEKNHPNQTPSELPKLKCASVSTKRSGRMAPVKQMTFWASRAPGDEPTRSCWLRPRKDIRKRMLKRLKTKQIWLLHFWEENLENFNGLLFGWTFWYLGLMWTVIICPSRLAPKYLAVSINVSVPWVITMYLELQASPRGTKLIGLYTKRVGASWTDFILIQQ